MLPNRLMKFGSASGGIGGCCCRDPDRYVGEDLVAFAVLRDGASCDERELLTFCESHLGHFKTPTRIYFVLDLPKGPRERCSGFAWWRRLKDALSRGPLFRLRISTDHTETQWLPKRVFRDNSSLNRSSLELVAFWHSRKSIRRVTSSLWEGSRCWRFNIYLACAKRFRLYFHFRISSKISQSPTGSASA